MAYREDLDAFAKQRVRDDQEAALFASFQISERARRRRTLAKLLGGALVVCAIYGGALAAPAPAPRGRAIAVRLAAPVLEVAKDSRRACARRAMDEYLAAKRDAAEALTQGDSNRTYKLEDFAKRCSSSN
jgi:hypothetical protein